MISSSPSTGEGYCQSGVGLRGLADVPACRSLEEELRNESVTISNELVEKSVCGKFQFLI